MTSARDEVRLSVAIVNFNGMGTLPGVLDSVREDPLPIEEIIVVDDGSTDGSVEWLRRQHPEIHLIAFDHNTGNVSKVRNAGLEAARGTHVFLTDNDVELQPGCLHQLLAAIQSDERVFCVTPRLMYHDRPDVLFQDGNGMHFLALGTGSRRGVPVAEAGVPAPFRTCGGGLMLFDRARLREVGGFDSSYMHAWADDAELQFRGMLYGFKCLHVPAAAATHHARDHRARRARGQIYNRFRVLATFHRKRTLLVMLPSLLLFEAALIVVLVVNGHGGAYLGALRQAWRDRRSALAARRELQRRRRVPDSELFWFGRFEIPGVVTPRPVLRRLVAVVQTVFDANWRLVRWTE
ncbi:MAG: glycosyltransferase family 2 protein [Burkholderiaceae bacterium]